MKYLIPILLIVFVSCGNAEEKYEWTRPFKEVDKKICFEAIKKGKVVDKQIEEYRPSQIRKDIEARNTVTDIIYKNKYYTLSIIRNDYEGYSYNLLIPSLIICRVYEESKKIKKKE
jgi:hypothetical protein|tara:strand:- start:369 stop:716 length:348 start_codon:yes stop_codon:yes gene_type:complete